MKLGPSLHQPLLRTWDLASDQFERVETENSHMLLVIRVEVRRMMSSACLHKHADDDPKKPADLGHDCRFYGREPPFNSSAFSRRERAKG